MSIPTFTVNCRILTHNTIRWSHCTNRHTSTNGNSWGWIENAPGNITWSNDSGSLFTSKDASEAIRIHNEWLEDQKSVVFKIIEARQNLALLQGQIDPLRTQLIGLEYQAAELKLKIQELENRE